MEDLSATDLEVLSIYGTQDKVLNMEKYEQYRMNLPLDMEEQIIDGGCHAYFGDYGVQDGDGMAMMMPAPRSAPTMLVTYSPIWLPKMLCNSPPARTV